MKRYPKYKDSGAPWLGQVPAHWEVKRLKRAFYETAEKSRTGDEQLAATQKYGVISQSQFMKAEDQKLVLALKGTDNFKHVEQDDFVISLRAFEGGIERSSQSGCVSPAYTVLRSVGDLSASYSARLLKTPAFISQISMTYDGIREGKAIKFKDAGPVLLPVPPAKEQAAIVNFIDRSVGQMDSAISSQERMIELLKERRSAIITQAVTKGLDPKAKMKDSGVPWLDQVPAHWQIRMLKTLSSPLRGGDWGAEPLGDGRDVKCVRAADIVTETQRIDRDSLISRSYPSGLTPSRALKKGDIVIEKSGGGDLVPVGRTVLIDVEEELTFSNFMGAVTPSSVVHPAFLALLFYVIHDTGRVVRYIKQTTGIQNLDSSALMSEFVPLPPLAEQIAICDYLELVRANVLKAQEKMNSLVALLKERRSSIITQAVTGQIDVR